MARAPQEDDLPWLAEGVREERATMVPRARLVGGGLVAVLLAVLVALGVFLAAGHKSDGSAGYARPEDAPLIAADPGPYKVAPENPGGAQITGIDDSVAAVASGGEQTSAIAPDAPEEPLARPAPGTAPPVDLLPPPRSDAPARVAAAPVVPPPVTPAPAATRATPPPPAPKPADFGARPSPAAEKPAAAAPPLVRPKPVEPKPVEPVKARPDSPPKVQDKPRPVDPLAPAKADATPAKADTPARGSTVLQLGAFSTRDKADAAWAKVASDGALSGLAKHIEPVERDGTTLYRLRAGGVSADGATALCARVKAAGSACIVAEGGR